MKKNHFLSYKKKSWLFYYYNALMCILNITIILHINKKNILYNKIGFKKDVLQNEKRFSILCTDKDNFHFNCIEKVICIAILN